MADPRSGPARSKRGTGGFGVLLPVRDGRKSRRSRISRLRPNGSDCWHFLHSIGAGQGLRTSAVLGLGFLGPALEEPPAGSSPPALARGRRSAICHGAPATGRALAAETISGNALRSQLGGERLAREPTDGWIPSSHVRSNIVMAASEHAASTACHSCQRGSRFLYWDRLCSSRSYGRGFAIWTSNCWSADWPLFCGYRTSKRSNAFAVRSLPRSSDSAAKSR